MEETNVADTGQHGTDDTNHTHGDGDGPEAGQDGPSAAQLVVANADNDGDGEGHGGTTQVDEPARLLRIAAMVKSLLSEVREADLDGAGRERLADVHNRALQGLNELVSEDLRDELEEVGLAEFGDEIPSGPELRVAQAQLAGWLEGLFRGIQASIANQQLAAQAQLAQQAQGGGGGAASRSGSGQYL